MKLSKKAFAFIFVVIILAYIGIFRLQNFDIGALASVNLTYIWLAMLALVCVLVLRSFKYHLLLKAAGLDVGLSAFKITILGFYANFLSPVRVSEIVRSYAVKKKAKTTFFRALPPTMIDSVIDILAMAAVIAVMSAVNVISADYWLKLGIVSLFALVALVGFYFMTTKTGEALTLRVIGIFSSKFLKREDVDPKEFIANSRLMVKNKKVLFLAFIVGCMVWFFEGLKLYFIIMATGVQISLLLAILIICVAYVLGGSLVNPSGVTQEAVLLVLLLQLPLAKQSMMMAGSIDAVLTIGTILVLGTAFALREGVKLSKLDPDVKS